MSSYKPDILSGFEQQTFAMPNDYEGKVVCTLVRKLSSKPSEQAVLYIHGFLDYFFQEEMANKFIEQGYNFYAVDLRKYGRSLLPNQRLSNLRRIDEYFADLDVAIEQIKAEGNKNLIIVAHSTGGLIAPLYLSKHKNICDALVLNSPFFEMNMNWQTRKISIPIACFFAKLTPNRTIGSKLIRYIAKLFTNTESKSKIPAFYGESLLKSKRGEWDYNLDWKPLKAQSITLSWLNGIHKAHNAIKRGLDLECPVLVLSSDKSMKGSKWTDEFYNADLVLNVEHIQHYADKLGKNVTKKTIAGGMHDLVLSKKPIRENVYTTIFDWLLKNK